MVNYCAAYNCTLKQTKEVTSSGVQFFLFPKDAEIRAKWTAALRRDNFKPTNGSTLCSKHFDSDCFEKSGWTTRANLKQGSIPTIFDFPEHLQRNVAKRKPPKQRDEPHPKKFTEKKNDTVSHASITDTCETNLPLNLSLPITTITMDQNVTSQINTNNKIDNVEENHENFASHNFCGNISIEANTEPSSDDDNRLGDQEANSHDDSLDVVESHVTDESPDVMDLSSKSVEMNKEKQKTFRKSYVGDFIENDMQDPRKARQFFRTAQGRIQQNRKYIKVLRQTVRRKTEKIASMEQLVDHLENQKLVTQPASALLLETLPDAGTRELYARLSSGEKGKYPVELRKFALTLSFYSTRAYKYVRQKFSNALPSVRTMQKWYQTVDGTPGFHEESLRAIKMKVADAQASGNKKVLLALSVDGVYIRKKIEWVGDKYIGYVNCGENIDGDNLPQASQALVFLLTCLNMRWKIPVAYFLINSMDDEQQAGLITKCLELTHETGAHVVSVTFDGHASNVSTAKCLGADIFSESIPTSFPHPITEQPIEVILDPCHMLKLIRNTLATKKILYDSKGRQIKWYYIEELVKIQNDEGLHLATRVRSRHMRWYKEKMKVNLAAQTLSRSVSKALEYLRKSNTYGERFKGSEATEEFIIAINDAFDILNSRNRFGNSFKAALQERNKNAYFDRIQNIIKILKGVKDRDNKTLIIKSKTRTGFLGMIAALQSVQNLYGRLVETGLLSYFCTYKISQDHIEVFFSAIRAKGGFNNNPTCRQFEAAYKRLLIHHEMSGPSTANCIELTPISILTVSSGKEKIVSEINPICIRSLELDDECEYPKTKGNDNGEIVLHLTTEHMRNMSEYVNDVVGHVAGLTLKKLKKVVHCETCLDALETGDYISKLSAIKNYDDALIGLQKPSQDLIDICKVTEAQILLMEKCNMLRNTTNLATRIQINVLSNVGNRCFDSLTDHMFDEIFEGNHIIALIKLIIKTYTDIRLHHDTNKLNELTLGDRVRSILTHSILFKGQ